MGYLLTPIDLKQSQSHLIKVGMAWAKALKRINHFTYVNPVAGDLNIGYLAAAIEMPILEQYRDDILVEDKQEIAGLLTKGDPELCKAFALAGSPGDIIENLINSHEYEFTLVGHDYERKGHSFFTGSVADKVVRKSDRPVAIIRNEKAANPKNILVLIDVEHDLDKIKSYAKTLAQGFGAELTFLSISPNYLKTTPSALTGNTGMNVRLQECTDDEHKKIQGDLEKIGAEFTGMGIKNSIKVLKEHVGVPESIIHYLEGNSSDLVVMGAHSQNVVERLFLGSVSYDLIHKTNQNIMLIK